MSSSVVHCETPGEYLEGSAQHQDEAPPAQTWTHPVQLGQKHGVLSAPAWVPMAALTITGRRRAVSSASTTASSSAVCTLPVLVLSLRVVGHGIRGKRVRLRRGRPGLR